MAKTEYRPARIRSEEDRGGGSSSFQMLDPGESFTGYALFHADPKEDEPGYYEYLEHWNQGARRYIPCAGDNCPLCEEGDKPKTRAKAIFLVTKNEKKDELNPPELRIFNMNYNLIKMFDEFRNEGDKIYGALFRVGKIDDRGNFNVVPRNGSLKVSEIKAHLKDKNAPDLDALVTGTLRKAMEALALASALDDDDDYEGDEEDNEPEEPKSKAKSKSKSKAKDDESAEWPEEFEGEVIVNSFTEGDNFFEARHDDYEGTKDVYLTGDEEDGLKLGKGQIVGIAATLDDDGDYVLDEPLDVNAAGKADDDEDEEADEATDDDGFPAEIEGEEYEVAGDYDEDNGTIPVKGEFEFDLWVLENVEMEWDDYTPGTKIIVNAKQDAAGDLVTAEAPEIVKSKSKSKGKAKKKGKK